MYEKFTANLVELFEQLDEVEMKRSCIVKKIQEEAKIQFPILEFIKFKNRLIRISELETKFAPRFIDNMSFLDMDELTTSTSDSE